MPATISSPATSVHPQGHAHDADLTASLDFLNTESYDDGVLVEHLAATEDAITWFVTHALAHEPALRAQAIPGGEAWLARVHAVRAALRAVWDAEVGHRIPDQGALDAVNSVLREAPRIELVAGDGCCGVGHRHSTDDATGEALAGVAQPIVRAIAARETDRFRVCANDGCRWVFEDTSRAGRRRWCDMTTCGNRAKVRRFRSRRRTGDGGADSADSADGADGPQAGDPAGDPAGDAARGTPPA